jgi:hypothetical protein
MLKKPMDQSQVSAAALLVPMTDRTGKKRGGGQTPSDAIDARINLKKPCYQ